MLLTPAPASGSGAVSAPPQLPDQGIARRPVSYTRAIACVALASGAAAPPLLVGVFGNYQPLTRIGQVSAVSAVMGAALVTVLVVLALVTWLAPRRPGLSREAVGALVAGTGSGIVAGIVAAALSGTSYGLMGITGDSRNLIRWADMLRELEPFSNTYPPGFPMALAAWAEARGIETAAALGELQILVIAVVGPLAYGAWRMSRQPLTAGALAGVSALAAVSPYKPYEGLALSLLLPMLAWVMSDALAAPDHAPRLPRLLGQGVALGLLCSLYSGWFYWSILAVPIWGALLPWTRAALRLAKAGATLAIGFVIGLIPTLWVWAANSSWTGSISDQFYSLDIYRGAARLLDPVGGVFGIGAMLLLLVVGAGLSIAFGPSNFAKALGPLVISGLLLRFWLSYRMGITGDVQLWQRTTRFLLTVLAVMAVAGFFDTARRIPLRGAVSPRRTLLAFGAAATLLVMLAGGVRGDSYMPNSESPARYALVAHLCPTTANCTEDWELPTGADGPWPQ